MMDDVRESVGQSHDTTLKAASHREPTPDAAELRILVLEDCAADAGLIERVLRNAGIRFISKRAETREDFLLALDDWKPTVILSDYQLPAFDGLSAVKLVRQRSVGIPVIMVTGAVGDEVATDLLKAGANDYILKDRLARLPFAIHRAVEEAQQLAARLRAEQSLRDLTRARVAVMHCNQALVRMQNEAELIHEVCRIIVEQAGYPLCCVGYAEDGVDKRVRIAASAGENSSGLEALNLSWGECEQGCNPVGDAIRTGESQILEDFASERSEVAWRDGALARGYASGIAIPLSLEASVSGSHPTGVLIITSARAGAWTEDEVELLNELADDLSYGIRTLRARVEQRKTQDELVRTQERLSGIFAASPNGIVFTSLDGVLMDGNDTFARAVGYTKQELIGLLRIQDLLADEHHERVKEMTLEVVRTGQAQWSEVAFVRKDGTSVPVQLTMFVVHRDDRIPMGLAIIIEDITERKAAEEKIRHAAYYDVVTELPNRVLFRDRLEQAVGLAQRNGRQVAVHFIDLDNFKLVNDSLGHAVGDALLHEVGRRLRACVRSVDTVARLGGDEFAVIQTDLQRKQGAGVLARKLGNTLSQPLVIDQRQLRTTASIGVTIYPDDGTDTSQILQKADLAMYHAKKLGRNNYQFYDASLNAEIQERMSVVADLYGAIERGEFVLHYQPQIDLRSGDSVAMEALIRWRHPRRGLVMPLGFIPIAEEEGLIGAVGKWTIHEACRQNRLWQLKGLPPRRVAVNISAKQFLTRDLLTTITDALDHAGLAPQWLEVELTESTLLRDVIAGAEMFSALHAMGVRVAIDDFGTGYSSLGYLSRLRVDTLKIDQSFVCGLPGDRDAATVVKTIIELGHNLGMKVIGEGIETSDQLAFLSERGCDEGQGYFLQRPVPTDELEAVLEAEQRAGYAMHVA